MALLAKPIQCWLGNTQAGSSHSGRAGNGAPLDADRSTLGGHSPRAGTISAGHVQSEQQHQTEYMHVADGMREHTHDRASTTQQTGRSGQGNDDNYPKRVEGTERGAERRSAGTGGVQTFAGTHSENAGVGGCSAGHTRWHWRYW